MLSNILLNPLYIPIVSSTTLILIVLQIWWNWLKNQPSLSIEDPKIILNTHRQGQAKEVILNTTLYIKNHSKMSNSVIKIIFDFEDAPTKREIPINTTIKGKTSERISLNPAFVYPDEPFKKQYRLTITLIDQHAKSYSSTSVIPVPEGYL